MFNKFLAWFNKYKSFVGAASLFLIGISFQYSPYLYDLWGGRLIYKGWNFFALAVYLGAICLAFFGRKTRVASSPANAVAAEKTAAITKEEAKAVKALKREAKAGLADTESKISETNALIADNVKKTSIKSFLKDKGFANNQAEITKLRDDNTSLNNSLNAQLERKAAYKEAITKYNDILG